MFLQVNVAEDRRFELLRGYSQHAFQQCWPAFTGVRLGHVLAAHGRWRTRVNAGQRCWKACWGQPLRSSNLLSSAAMTCKNTLGGAAKTVSTSRFVSVFGQDKVRAERLEAHVG